MQISRVGTRLPFLGILARLWTFRSTRVKVPGRLAAVARDGARLRLPLQDRDKLLLDEAEGEQHPELRGAPHGIVRLLLPAVLLHAHDAARRDPEQVEAACPGECLPLGEHGHVLSRADAVP